MSDHDANGSAGHRFVDLSQLVPAAPDQQAPPSPSGSPSVDPAATTGGAGGTERTRSVGPRPERTRLVSDPPQRQTAPVAVPSGPHGTGGTNGTAGPPSRPRVRLDHDFLVADDPTVWPDAQGATAPLLDLPDRDRLPALEVLAAGGRRLVVIVTRAQEQRVRALAAAARSLFDARIAVVTVDRGPALRAAAALIGQITSAPPVGRPVAEIIERLPALTDQLGHLVLLKAVHRVDHPAVGFTQHLISYLPGRRLFVLQTAPAPALARVNARGEYAPADVVFSPAAFDLAHGVGVAVLGPRMLPDGLLERLGVDATPSAMPVSLDPARHWPDAEATEIVLMPQDVTGWVRAELPAPETWPCRWCGEPLAAPIRSCPFCADTLG